MKILFNLSRTHFFRVRRRMSTEGRKVIAVCQMTSKNNKDDNLATCADIVKQASLQGAKVIFFPEACDYIGENRKELLRLAEPLDGVLMGKYCELAKRHNVWLSLGGIHEKVSDDQVGNAHVIINSDGNIVSVYHKAHLFDVELPEKGVMLKESDYVLAGQEIVPPVSSPVGKIGLAICYDMRFPELSLAMRRMGADILTYPSAFTAATGAAHWEIIMRARAIENQCYVVAAAQTGTHNAKRSSWGHAMIIDPWGTVVAQCSEGVGFMLAEIKLDYIQSLRASMPLWQHRRYDLYPDFTPVPPSADKEEIYQFGQTTVKGNTVFYNTKNTIAFTNKKCVLPGHVLVAPKRVAKRIADLRSDEVSDLFLSVKEVQKAVEAMYNASSSTVCVQDGEDAGQTIQHVHVHILPRRPGDFAENDQIYSAIEKHDKEGKRERALNEMVEEATKLQGFFTI